MASHQYKTSQYTFEDGSELPYHLRHACMIVKKKYNEEVFVKPKSLTRFGYNPEIEQNVKEQVWRTGGLEVLPSANTINRVVSTSLTDTQVVVIEGHILSGPNLIFVTQTVTLTGTTPVTLPTPLARATYLQNKDTTDFAGLVTVTDSTTGFTHLTVNGDHNKSLKAGTSISATDFWFITNITLSVGKTNPAVVEFDVEVRQNGYVWVPVFMTSLANSSAILSIDFDPVLIIRNNSDLRITALSDSNNTSVYAQITGYLANTGKDIT